MKRRIVCVLLAVLTVLALASCAREPESVCGLYARGDVSELEFDAFTIRLREDGTYQYYATILSSYIGMGEYTLEDGIVTLVDENIPGLTGSLTHTFRFRWDGDQLIYLADGSDQFMYVSLPDGAQFERVEESGEEG